MPSSGFQTCARSEEHTSELQSHDNLVCRLLLEKKHLVATDGLDCCAGEASVRLCPCWRLRLAPARQRHEGSRCCFFNDTATTEIYTLSLHDALPINDTATTEIYTLSLHDVPISVVAVSFEGGCPFSCSARSAADIPPGRSRVPR